MTNYKPSETLIEHIMKTEGVRLEAYRCPAGVWTIGCGHTKGVKQGDRITEAQVRQLLMDDLKEPLRYVNALDLCLAIPRHGYGALYIEMKRSGTYQRPEQRRWQEAVEDYGNKYVVCRSRAEFSEVINNYLADL